MYREAMAERTHAIFATQAGGPEVFEWQNYTPRALNDGEIRVRTAAAGLNFIEVYQRSGVYPVEYPFLPGSEGAGEVTEVADGVTDFAVGDRVMSAAAEGTYSEEFIVPAAQAAAVPESVSLKNAAAIPLQGCTAHYLANSVARPEKGDAVLIHAGAGGVGLILTQLLASRGVRVFTTAGSPEKRDLSRAAGAEVSFSYDDFVEQVREKTDGVGVQVAYDGVGKTTFDGSLDSLAVRGTLALFGGASGQVPAFDLQRLNQAGSVSVTRPSLGHFMQTVEERRWRYRDLTDALSNGDVQLRIGQEFALKDAADAHRALEARETTGKTLLVP